MSHKRIGKLAWIAPIAMGALSVLVVLWRIGLFLVWPFLDGVAWLVDTAVIAVLPAWILLGFLVGAALTTRRAIRTPGLVAMVLSVGLGVWFSLSPTGLDETTTQFELLVFNGNSRNLEFDGVASLVDLSDLGVLCELSPEMVRAIRQDGLLAGHPHIEARAPVPGESGWVLVVSRWPLERVERDGSMLVRIASPFGDFELVAMHAPSPRSVSRWRRGCELMFDAPEPENSNVPLVVAGDLNAPRWTARARLLERRGYRRAKPLGLGGGTWPARSIWPFRVAIDDAWCGDGLRVTSWRTGPASGSDHLPVSIGLSLD